MTDDDTAEYIVSRPRIHILMPFMRRVVPIWLLFAACAGPASDEQSPGVGAVAYPKDEALRHELLARLERDQEFRLALARQQQQGEVPDSLELERLLAVDTANTAWLKKVVAERGWPVRSLVGADGANAAFILVQHADHDTAFQVRVLPLLERAYAAGEAEGQQVALLSDRLAVARGEPQIYGSQVDMIGGRVVLKPVRDSAGIDARRASVGLPPLAEYVRLLDSLYAGPPKP